MNGVGEQYTLALSSEVETELFGKIIASHLVGGNVVCLNGELGSGKTTLVRSIVQNLGSKVPVSSPTFVLSHEYTIDSGNVLEHWDLYRLSAAPEEILEPPTKDVIRVIEWAERAPHLHDCADLVISLLVVDGSPDARRASLSGPIAVSVVSDPKLQGLRK